MAGPDVSALNSVAVDLETTEPLYLQIYDQVRDLILTGRLGAGARLPSTRALAGELGVSRTTTLAAYDQLASEGYLEGQPGSGAYVAPELPDDLLTVPASSRSAPPAAIRTTAAPTFADGADGVPRAFDTGVPDTAAFPFAEWSRLLARSWREPAADMLHQGLPAGAPDLRIAIADHVRAMRGIDCAPEQVFVTSGAAETIRLIAGALFDEGDRILVEDPCYPAGHLALRDAGCEVEEVAVDKDGFQLANAGHGGGGARAVLITPSRQYPLGMTLPLARRLELLSWAAQSDAWVLEDDYDSEYRYIGRPLEPMMNLDTDGRVIYLGSFSKVMFKALRLGYMIVPPGLIETVARYLDARSVHASLIPQAALAAFINKGLLAQHVRRMRRLYAERSRFLNDFIRARAPDLLTIERHDAGMHLVAAFTDELAARRNDVDSAARAAASGVTVAALSEHYRVSPPRQGFLLGFAGFGTEDMERAGRTLIELLRSES